MTGNIFKIKLLSPKYLLTLFLLIFAVSVLYLQSLKAPWVDECYSYYGVWHDSFSEFYNSMLTGINFSPPLYFLFNFCLQLAFPTSIEQLRIQSLIFILIGIVLSFLLTRKIFGSGIAFVATILVTSQSNLLLAQAQEARHYAMFFVCGVWVLSMQSIDNYNTKRINWLTFLAHFCLCQVHYLGIIFSGLVGLSFLITKKKQFFLKRIPLSIFAVWIFTLPVYLLLLNQQSSHLGNWPKPNGFSDLFGCYNDSYLILTFLIPSFTVLLTKQTKKNKEALHTVESNSSSPIIVTSFLWICVPLIFWVLSHVSSLNLFVDRYFIPKEIALTLLVACGLSYIFQKLTQQKLHNITLLGTFAGAIFLILISTKRRAFAMNKSTCYHHSLIIEETFPHSEQPIILEGDPKYFPNAYLGKNEYIFTYWPEPYIDIYKRFSTKIKILE